MSAGWEVHDRTAVHIVPVNDGVGHEFDMDCACGPHTDFSGDRPVVTHHSLDGREAAE